jgi:hypothetical protein
VRAAHEVDDIALDGWVDSSLECLRVVLSDGEESLVVEPVDPRLRVRLSTLDGSNVVGLSVV